MYEKESKKEKKKKKKIEMKAIFVNGKSVEMGRPIDGREQMIDYKTRNPI